MLDELMRGKIVEVIRSCSDLIRDQEGQLGVKFVISHPMETLFQ